MFFLSNRKASWDSCLCNDYYVREGVNSVPPTSLLVWLGSLTACFRWIKQLVLFSHRHLHLFPIPPFPFASPRLQLIYPDRDPVSHHWILPESVFQCLKTNRYNFHCSGSGNDACDSSQTSMIIIFLFSVTNWPCVAVENVPEPELQLISLLLFNRSHLFLSSCLHPLSRKFSLSRCPPPHTLCPTVLECYLLPGNLV